ncbi:hypothetical protein VNO77_08240 [Canavalia gladiata]|uniref:Uncharacterized protein n=1 Tax=Canavalia gladiata TaxID=3824 RepID=A0AAN9MDX4_CANGL
MVGAPKACTRESHIGYVKGTARGHPKAMQMLACAEPQKGQEEDLNIPRTQQIREEKEQTRVKEALILHERTLIGRRTTPLLLLVNQLPVLHIGVPDFWRLDYIVPLTWVELSDLRSAAGAINQAPNSIWFGVHNCLSWLKFSVCIHLMITQARGGDLCPDSKEKGQQRPTSSKVFGGRRLVLLRDQLHSGH